MCCAIILTKIIIQNQVKGDHYSLPLEFPLRYRNLHCFPGETNVRNILVASPSPTHTHLLTPPQQGRSDLSSKMRGKTLACCPHGGSCCPGLGDGGCLLPQLFCSSYFPHSTPISTQNRCSGLVVGLRSRIVDV